MTDAITQEEYDEEVDEHAAWLAEEALETEGGEVYDDPTDAAYELVSDILDGHNWFARSYFGASLYGSIIEHGHSDTGRYSDWQALSEAETPAKSVKKMAYVVFEADVIAEAVERIEDE